MLKNIYWGLLKNEDLGRTLTKQELAAVDWWVTKILWVEKTQYKYNAKRSVISCGDIPGILATFKEYAGDKEWENALRITMRSMREKVKTNIMRAALDRNVLPRQRGCS